MTESEPIQPARSSDGTPGIALMILGAVIAVLGPLFGLLGGSMAGSPDPDSTGQLFEYFVGGLFVGGLGAVVIFLGFVRYRRWRRNHKGDGGIF